MKPAVFLAFANSSASPLPHLAEEYHRLEAILKQAEQKGHCELVVAPYATVDDVLGTFQDERYRGRIAIFHYAGHAGNYQLLLQGADGLTAVANAGGLAAFLAHQNGLQLVFLNGCATQPQAQGLLDAGAAAVIATAQAIDDQVATDFASRFYEFLAGGDAIGVAFAKAQAAVQTVRGGDPRHLYAAAGQDTAGADRWPWECAVRPGAEVALRWNLPDAAGDPLFGLPPIPDRYYRSLPDHPFRGLGWFAVEHAAVFFGRGYQVRELYQQVVAPRTPPLILFYGQSGVGKSSLLAAGLAPRLEAGHTIGYLRRNHEQGLLGALQAALQEQGTAATLAAAWATRETRAGRPLLAILDQAEEVFTRPNVNRPCELGELLDALQTLTADPERWPQGKLILGFRKEWLAEIKRQVEEHKLPHTELFLQRLDRRDVIEAIEGPARVAELQAKYRLTIADNLPGLIADDLLADPGSAVAPTLQILLTKLWAEAKQKSYDRPTFDADLYGQLRAQGLGLRDILDQQLAELGQRLPEVVASGLALDLLAYHTTPLGTAEEHTREDLRQTYANRQDVLEPLVQECGNLYLLVDTAKNEPGNPPASRLAHDTLAPLVRRRFSESDAPGQRAWRILESRAMDWQTDNVGAPLDDADLAVVNAGAGGMRAWTDAEQRLVAASRKQQARRRRRTRLVQGVLAGAVLLIIAVAGVAWWQWGLAAEQELAARRQAYASDINLAEQAFNNKDAARVVELLDRQRPSLLQPDLREFAWRYLWRLHHRALHILNAQAEVSGLAFSPDGKTLATQAPYNPDVEAGEVRLWDAASGQARATLKFEQHTIYAATFTPDGQSLTTVDTVQVKGWDVASGKLRASTDHCPEPDAVRLTPDAKVLIVLCIDFDNATFEAWDVATATKLSSAVYAGQAIPYNLVSVDIAPDDKMVAMAFEDGTMLLWDMATQETEFLESNDEGFGSVIGSVAFSPDGKLLATAHGAGFGGLTSLGGSRYQEGPGKVTLWNVGTGQEQVILEGHTGGVHTVEFAPDGKTLVSVSGEPNWLSDPTGDSEVKLWDLATSKERFTLRQPDGIGFVVGVAFSPDGSLLALQFSGDETVQLRDAASGKLRANLHGHTGAVRAMVFAPDGKTLATGGADGTARLWDTSPDPREFTPPFDKVFITAAAFTPDGESVATGTEAGDVIFWDAATLRDRRAMLRGQTRPVRALAFTSDGKTLASWSDDGIVALWDTLAGSETITISGPAATRAAMVFAPGGKQLAVALDPDGRGFSAVKVWDVASGAEVNGHAPPPGELKAIAPDASTLAIYDEYETRTLYLWNRITGKRQNVFSFSDYRFRVHAVTFSADGKLLIVAQGADSPYRIRIFDTETLQERVTLDGHAHDIHALALSPDGKTLASASLEEVNDSVTPSFSQNAGVVQVMLWDVATELPRGSFVVGSASINLETLANHSSLRFSPDGNALAITELGTLTLWDPLTGQVQATLDRQNAGALQSMAFTQDDRVLVVTRHADSPTRQESLSVWDAVGGEQLSTVLGPNGETWSLAYAPDGKILAVASEDHAVRLYDPATARLQAILEGHTADIWSVAFAPDGKTLASGSADHDIKLWDVASGKEQATLRGHAGGIRMVAFAPDGRALASASDDGALKVWDVATGKERLTLEGHTGGVWSVAFAPDGKTLASSAGNDSGEVKLWDAETGALQSDLDVPTAGVRSLAFSPDGAQLATGSIDGLVKVWNLPAGTELATHNGRGTGETTPAILQVTFSKDGKRLAAASAARTVWIWDEMVGLSLVDDAHVGEVRSLAFAPDGATLATASADGGVKLWAVESDGAYLFNPELHAVLKYRWRTFDAVALAPDGKTMATGGSDKAVTLWDVASGQRKATLLGYAVPVESLAYAADGKTLATAAGGEVKLWNTSTGEPIASFEGGPALAFGPGVAAVSDGGAKVWDVASSKEKVALRDPDQTATAIAIASDGKTVATGSADGLVKVWDATTGKERFALKDHRDAVRAVAFSPDGKTLATGGADQTVKLWDPATGRLLLTLYGLPEEVEGLDFAPDGETLAARYPTTIVFWDAAAIQ